MSTASATSPAEPSPSARSADFKASVEAAAAACGGDLREAVWELLIRNAWLEGEVDRLSASVSRGYVRHRLAAMS